MFLLNNFISVSVDMNDFISIKVDMVWVCFNLCCYWMIIIQFMLLLN